jgi:gluconolactonase
MKLETIAHGYGLIEGPRVDPEGRLFFSDVPRGGVYCRLPDGSIETVVPKRRGVGGIALHADGGLVLSGRNICHVRAGETRLLFERDDVAGWNDIFTDAAGRVLAGSLRSDPFGRDAGAEPGDLWRIDAPGRGTRLYGDVKLSNGIGLSPDGTRLYHSDSVPGEILVHELSPDGDAKRRRVLARLESGVPDGLAVDEQGGVWVAVYGGGRVARYSADGELEREIEVPASSVTSLCFGGPDRRDLYITSADNTEAPERRGTIFRTRSPVAGLPVAPARI